ncbi:hypothetical protein O181_010727 [Austropuccinia psidii MF-1]|uniref:superoxide dismutase n=1 Tax=Austropuccinia psidii MF-1 TaxID=1389203 RepID=A0A9Q3GLG9_9BASI|nr:hypothetical protein [Austropuccinia psidii MF-1]
MLQLALPLVVCMLFRSVILAGTANNVSTLRPSIVPTARASLKGRSGVRAQFDFVFSVGANAMVVVVHINGLDKVNPKGEFAYHIHTNPIGPDGNCTAALEHLNPKNASANCDFLKPEYCQVGDLSGKFGKISGAIGNFTAHYIDPFLRFVPEAQSILGRSVVIHAPDSSRIACGNITSKLDGTETGDGKPTSKPSTYVKNHAKL